MISTRHAAAVEGYIGQLQGMETILRLIGWEPEAKAAKQFSDKLVARVDSSLADCNRE